MAAGAAAVFHVGNKSDVGRVRDVNEDFFGAWSRDGRRLFVVADGMGGMRGGFEASRTAVHAVRSEFDSAGDVAPGEFLHRAVAAANAACLEKQQADPDLREMGTTLDVLLVERDTEVWWAHVGDSRIILVRDAQPMQVTEDHTVVQQLVKGGLVNEDEAREHPQRHVLNRVVGRDVDLEPDVSPAALALRDGDVIVMCTDGLSDLVTPEEVAHVTSRRPPQRASERLVALARARGGHDNITVQVLHKGDPPAAWTRVTTAIGLAATEVNRPLTRRRVHAVAAAVVLLLLAAAGFWFGPWASLLPSVFGRTSGVAP